MTAEQICRQAVANGEVADLTVLPEDQRVLSAAFVRRLVRGVERDENGNAVEPQPSGVRVKGLRLVEDLDLSNIDVGYPVELTDGHFDGRVNLQDAGLRSLSLDRSTFKRPVDARNMETRSDFCAVEATFEDWLSLAGAEIQGDVWLQGAYVRSQTPVDRLAIAGPQLSEGVAIDADGIVVGGNLYMFAVAGGRRFEAAGQVRLLGAKIAGQFNCIGSLIQNTNCDALIADGMEIGGDMFLAARNSEIRFEASGTVRLPGAKIAGQLNCNGGSFQNPEGVALSGDGMEIGGDMFLEARNKETRFEANGEVRLPGAKIAGVLSCNGGSFQNPGGIALNADRMEVGGTVYLRGLDKETRFEANGEVRLLGASIRSNLECTGGSFQNPDGHALCADGIEIGGDVYLRALDKETRFEADGEVRLPGAKIRGDLGCTGGSFRRPAGKALVADRMEVGGGVFLLARDKENRFEANGEVRLLGAKISGSLECTGGSFHNPNGNALSTDGIEIGGSVHLRALDRETRFNANGTVRLPGAKIAGVLSCNGGSFQNQGGIAIGADRMEVGGSVFLVAREKEIRFEANGEVRLLGSRIKSGLECTGGSFQNPNGNALSADGIEIGGDIHLRALDKETKFEANGIVRLPGAKIGGDFRCTGGSFQNPGGSALIADRIEVGGNVFMRAMDEETMFESNGQVRLHGAKIGGNLEFIGGNIQNLGGESLAATNLEVGGSLHVRKGFGNAPRFDGEVVLTSASFGSYFQWRDARGTHGVNLSHASAVTLDLNKIAHPEQWHLNGFRYQGLAEPEIADGEEIFTLLRKCEQGEYFPQPYRQLFRCLRDAGHAEEATNVAVAMRQEAFLHEREKLSKDQPRLWLLRSWFSEFWEWTLWLIGFGYRPWRAVGIALTLWAVGSLIYAWVAFGPFHDFMAPAEGDLLAVVQTNPSHDWRTGGPPFVSWLYALDRFMPIVDLGQASFFRPKMNTGHTLLGIDVGWWLNAYDWLLIASGWVLSLLFAGSVSGLMRKIDSDA